MPYKSLFVFLALILAACHGGGGPSPGGFNYPYPRPGEWVTYGGHEPQVVNGSFDFGCCDGKLISGYYYTQFPTAPKAGQMLVLNYHITGNNPVWVQAPYDNGPTDTNPPTLHLFLWRKGDNGLCDAVTTNYRLFAGRTNLVFGAIYTAIGIPLDNAVWTNCNGQNPSIAEFSDVLNNLAGAGFTFGGQSFAGHGIYLSSGSATFTINSFIVQ